MIQRCFQYYDNPNETEKENIFEFILITSSEVFHRKDVNQILRLYFHFLKNHRKFFKMYLKNVNFSDRILIRNPRRNLRLWNMVQRFIANSDTSNDEETQEICFDLLSIYEKDKASESALACLVQETRYSYIKNDWDSIRTKCWIDCDGMEKLLTALRARGRNKTLQAISQLVLSWRLDVYERIY